MDNSNSIQPITPPPQVALSIPDEDDDHEDDININIAHNEQHEEQQQENDNNSSSISTTAATTMSFPRAMTMSRTGRLQHGRHGRRRTNRTNATGGTGSTTSIRVGRILPSFGDRLSMAYIISVVCSTIGILIAHRGDGPCVTIRFWLWANAALTLARGTGKLARIALNRTRNFNRASRATICLAYTVRILTTVAVAWFVVGLVFVLLQNKKGARSKCSKPVLRLAMALVVIEMTMLFLSLLLGLLIFLFAPHPAGNSLAGLGLSDDNIEKLKKFEYIPEKHGGQKNSINGNNDNDNTDVHGDNNGVDSPICAICLCEYEKGDILRELPCAHRFHASCVDVWLMQVASCPVCREEIRVLSVGEDLENQNNNRENGHGRRNSSRNGNSNGNGNNARENGGANGDTSNRNSTDRPNTASVVVDVARFVAQESSDNNSVIGGRRSSVG